MANKMSKSEKDALMESYEDNSKELIEYRARAISSGYGPSIPKLPKKEQQPELLRSTITGFYKRFSNWKKNFVKFEETKEFEDKLYM